MFIRQKMEDAGEIDKANRILDEALSAARKVKDLSSQSRLLESMAHQFARRGFYRSARLIADLCSASQNRIDAYAAILTEYAKAQNPDLRALYEAEEREAKEREAEQKRKEQDEEN